MGKWVLTVLLAVVVGSLIWFFPVIPAEAPPRVPTQIIEMIPSQFPLDIDGDGILEKFEIASETRSIGGAGIIVFDDVSADNNKVSFHFNQGTSRDGKSSFSHFATVVIGTSFLAPHTGTYEITFLDRAFIDVTKTFAHINFIPPPRADTNYVTSFAKFSYDIRAENYNDGTANYFTSGNSDTKDMNIFISSPTIRAEGLGEVLPTETFASRNPGQAVIITVAGTAVSNIVVGAVSGLICNVCASVVIAATSPFIAEQIEGLLNEDSNLFGAIIGPGGSGIVSQKNFGRTAPSATTFEVELDKGELVFLSSKIIIGIDQADTSSRHRHAAGIAGDYELQQISIKIFESTPPVITLQGDNPLVLEAGVAYVEPGATVADNVAGYDEEVVVDSSGVDSDTVGSYIVTYNAPPDLQGNVPLQVTRTVDVVDNTPPEISLLGPNPLILQVGDTYLEPGAIVTDNTDEDLSGALVIDSSAVDTSTLGTYIVTYDVFDSSGNAATQVTRTVEVFDQVIDTVVDGPLKVGSSERVFISGGTINGNIKLGAGTLIFEDATINGNIQGNVGSAVSLENSTVSGFVQMKNCASLTIVDSQIDSNVTVQNCENLTLTDSTVGGHVDSKNTQTIVVTGNTVSGSIGSNGDGQATIEYCQWNHNRQLDIFLFLTKMGPK